jgi:hypothetical protein
MKMPKQILVLCALLFVPLTGAVGSGLYIESPDYPAVWYNRTGDKVGQELAWNRAKQLLILYVSYGNQPVIEQRNPLSYDSFQLTFPRVHLDPSTAVLYSTDEKGRRTDIGRLNPGMFGTKVILNPGIDVIVHRGKSFLSAALQSGQP